MLHYSNEFEANSTLIKRLNLSPRKIILFITCIEKEKSEKPVSNDISPKLLKPIFIKKLFHSKFKLKENLVKVNIYFWLL